jgi:SAM-dependent methyltransferase
VSEHVPQTRWERLAGQFETKYAGVFEDLIARGEDIDGEARLADVLVPRAARILDAGAGLGRVAAALLARGHDVTAVEKDPDLIARAHRLFPHVVVVEADILELTPALLDRQGRPSSYDLIVVVGNVMVYLAEDTESRALRTLVELLAPDGRILVGFAPEKGPPHSREYSAADFRQHARTAGLVVEHEFSTYDLAPAGGDYLVAVLRRA